MPWNFVDARTQMSNMVFIIHILSNLKKEQGQFDCPICYENVSNSKRITISCGHTFCCECTKEWLYTCNDANKNVTCPMCRYSCFLLETPDEIQFQEISKVLELISEYKIDQIEREAFMYHHLSS